MTYALIVNSDHHQREAIAAAFGDDGISSRVARSEQHAVVALQEDLPAVLVWDWPARDMPPEIFLAVLRQEGFQGALVICAPSSNLNGIPYDVLIRKPFDLEHLITAVGRLLIEEADVTRQAGSSRSNGL